MVNNDLIPHEEDRRITAISTDNAGLLYVRCFYEKNSLEKIYKFHLNGKKIEEFNISSLGLSQYYDTSSSQIFYEQCFTKYVDNNNYKIPVPIPGYLSMEIDNNNNIFLNIPVTQLSPKGKILQSWRSHNDLSGEFFAPQEIVIGKNNNNFLYILDSLNFRIQVLTKKGKFIKQIKIPEHLQFTIYHSMSLNYDREHYFLASPEIKLKNLYIPALLIQLDKNGSPLFVSNYPELKDIYFYKDIVDHRECLATLHQKGLTTYQIDEDGRLHVNLMQNPSDNSTIVSSRSWQITDNLYYNQFNVDSANRFIYISATDENFENCTIYKYDFSGILLNKWRAHEKNNELVLCSDISTDNKGNIYVLLNSFGHTFEDVINKYSQDGKLIATFGGSGIGPGMLSEPKSVCASSDGITIFVADSGNNRIQVFTQKKRSEGMTKAIIIAGGGSYDGNTIWDATQMNANYAYQSMLSNGIHPDEIFYLSASKNSLNQDMDNDGIPDIDDVEKRNSLIKILSNNVNDADLLVIYLIDHGGYYENFPGIEGFFHLNDFEEPITASELNTYLELFKKQIVLIIDACYSGHFIHRLSSKDRIIISSASANERASFLSQGTISFSHAFWSRIYKGNHVQESFDLATTQIKDNCSQTP